MTSVAGPGARTLASAHGHDHCRSGAGAQASDAHQEASMSAGTASREGGACKTQVCTCVYICSRYGKRKWLLMMMHPALNICAASWPYI